jgi:hypothetical protein
MVRSYYGPRYSSCMHAEAAHDCGVPTGSVHDFSTMTPFTATNALP